MRYFQFTKDERVNKIIMWTLFLANVAMVILVSMRMVFSPNDSCFKDCEMTTIQGGETRIIRANCSYITNLEVNIRNERSQWFTGFNNSNLSD